VISPTPSGKAAQNSFGFSGRSARWAVHCFKEQTLTGLLETAAPNGRTETGLPIGVQIIGGFLEDRTTIAFAGLIERECGGFTPPPNL
jgi:Asp-tRNA(Asn)/Glu-tRNA(Gln) amidotransferase A subunit family amidase